ncbi:AAA family ATPase, partial [Aliarcobacter butzleri]|uniref:AAA family ATPase n=1 Tax=Aliarcobacter butzleri TaxID=28197 RepID=UPI003AE00896
MAILSIKIDNLLSFDKINVDAITDINCLVGMNNVGKSNFLKLIQFFYDKLDNKYIL